MKDIWYFICWQYRNLQTWQKLYILSAFLFGLGIGWYDTLFNWLSITGVSLICIMICKWCIWNAVSVSYRAYRKERDNLFQNIKESDKK